MIILTHLFYPDERFCPNGPDYAGSLNPFIAQIPVYSSPRVIKPYNLRRRAARP